MDARPRLAAAEAPAATGVSQHLAGARPRAGDVLHRPLAHRRREMEARSERPALHPPWVLRAGGGVREMDGPPPAHRRRSGRATALGRAARRPAGDLSLDADL